MRRPSALTCGGAPPATSIDVRLVGLTNVMRQIGIARRGAATPMAGGGPAGQRYLRLMFAAAF